MKARWYLGCHFCAVASIFSAAISPICQAEARDDKTELVIYTYDAFLARGGLGSVIFPLFEKKYHCRVRALASGEGGQILARLQLDAQRGKRVAHLVLGIDQNLWERAKPWLEGWGEWEPKGYSQLLPESFVERGFLPLDYGIFAIMADQEFLNQLHLTAPNSLSDLMNPRWKRNLILEDPRTSTPGLAFLLLTKKIFGTQVWNFWSQLKGQWLTLTPGWNEAYGLFLKKEAPLVWSYITSQAYHDQAQQDPVAFRRYTAVLFQEGQPYQIEGAAWVKGALQTEQEKQLARHFLEFLISPEVQQAMIRTHWMLPVLRSIGSTELPKSYQDLPKPTRLIRTELKGQQIEDLLSQWGRVVP